MIRRPRRRNPRPRPPADLDAIRARLSAPAWSRALAAIDDEQPRPDEAETPRRPRADGGRDVPEQ